MPEPSVDPVTTIQATTVEAGVQQLVLEPTPAGAPVAVDKAATKKFGIVGWIAIVWIVLVVGGALLAPVLPLPKPSKTFVAEAGDGPSASHLFGLDSSGQDMFSRVVWGARASLLVSVGSVLFGLTFGGTLGLIAGYYRGRLDTFLSYIFNIFLAIPPLVLALALVAVFASEPSVTVTKREMWLIIAVGIVSIPIIGRITRASTLTWSQREFVLAARSMGAKNRRIIIRDVLPNVLPAMFSIALLSVAVVIVVEGGLSVLGVGVPASTPSWGNLVAIGRNELTKVIGSAPQVIFAPAFAIFSTVLSLNYLGDVVRARFDVRESAI